MLSRIKEAETEKCLPSCSIILLSFTALGDYILLAHSIFGLYVLFSYNIPFKNSRNLPHRFQSFCFQISAMLSVKLNGRRFDLI